MEFEWDEAKAATNVGKHSVSFQEAETVFGDPFELTIPDAGHSGGETRWVSMGYSAGGRLDLGGQNAALISARTASPREISAYERKKR